MIVLDTNVLSELMRAQPNEAVLSWLDSQNAQNLKTTAVTVAELLYAIERLPQGRRKAGLHDAADAMLADELAGRVIAFDENAARHYATLVAARDTSGRPISAADAQIAAICRQHEAVLATRNGKDFEETGVTVIDPWMAV
jgi:predicted nucleic acid-binding protein